MGRRTMAGSTWTWRMSLGPKRGRRTRPGYPPRGWRRARVRAIEMCAAYQYLQECLSIFHVGGSQPSDRDARQPHRSVEAGRGDEKAQLEGAVALEEVELAGRGITGGVLPRPGIE